MNKTLENLITELNKNKTILEIEITEDKKRIKVEEFIARAKAGEYAGLIPVIKRTYHDDWSVSLILEISLVEDYILMESEPINSFDYDIRLTDEREREISGKKYKDFIYAINTGYLIYWTYVFKVIQKNGRLRTVSNGIPNSTKQIKHYTAHNDPLLIYKH